MIAGETPKAIVVKAADADVAAQDVIAYAKERLAGYKCPTSVDFTDALPRHDTGKIYKRLLRDEYRKREAGGGAGADREMKGVR